MNRPLMIAAALLLAHVVCRLVAGQEHAEVAQPKLVDAEERIEKRYERLELLAGRLSELSRATQPRRARLLRELVATSRERDVAGRFQSIIQSLRNENFGVALEDQVELQSDLKQLLELLLREDRDRQLESERKRIAKYLAEVKKLIRKQRGINARTEGGEPSEELQSDQKRVAQATGELKKSIDQTEGIKQPSSPGASDSNESSKGSDKPSEQSDPGGSPDGKSPPSGGKAGEPSPASGEGQPSDDAAEAPSEKATKRLEQARKRMKQANERLKQAQREKAEDQQEQALRELEQAKSELERILRQLREEELQQMLMLLEARLRRMLKSQNEIYEETKKLDAAGTRMPEHELEIASGRLGRKEQQIVREAGQALILLREDGTSVAFPEAIDQARDDMIAAAERLDQVHVGLITQGLEEDIIAALEESLAALRKALQEIRQQQAQQKPSDAKPGEQPLVDHLAELRMIRALQMRINKRTEQFGRLFGSEQVVEQDLLKSLDRLAVKQQRVLQATRDLDTGRNE